MSAAFVVDCSIAMAWLFHDEATPKTAALLNRLATETVLVSGLVVHRNCECSRDGGAQGAYHSGAVRSFYRRT